jgi:hypothetical protein
MPSKKCAFNIILWCLKWKQTHEYEMIFDAKYFLKLSFIKTFSRWLWFKDQIEEANTTT